MCLGAKPAKIFVNYRRSNAREPAFLIAARLMDRYGAGSAFIDENLSGGEVFPTVLQRRHAQCCVLLIVMGPGWLEATDNDGSRHLDSPTDWVREEIRRALKRGIPVLPVLINGVTVPSRAALPGDIADLVDHHGLPVRTDDHAFKGHMLLLTRDIDRIVP